jgi:hypothetical protein
MSESYGLGQRPDLLLNATKLFQSVQQLFRDLFLYFGLFLIPVCIPIAWIILRALSPRVALVAMVAIASATAAIAATALQGGLLMPVWPHTWKVSGIGYDCRGIPAPQIFLELVTVLSVFGGVLLVFCLVCTVISVGVIRRGSRTWELVFALSGAAIMVAGVCFAWPKFDRYLLPILPFAMYALVLYAPAEKQTVSRWSLGVGAVFLAGMTWYSVVNEHNCLAEKRTTKRAIDDLVARGAPREDIDVLWVFNGEFVYGRFGVKHSPKRNWFRNRDYIVGKSPPRDYTLVQRYSVPRWPLWGSEGADVRVYARKLDILPPQGNNP